MSQSSLISENDLKTPLGWTTVLKELAEGLHPEQLQQCVEECLTTPQKIIEVIEAFEEAGQIGPLKHVLMQYMLNTTDSKVVHEVLSEHIFRTLDRDLFLLNSIRSLRSLLILCYRDICTDQPYVGVLTKRYKEPLIEILVGMMETLNNASLKHRVRGVIRKLNKQGFSVALIRTLYLAADQIFRSFGKRFQIIRLITTSSYHKQKATALYEIDGPRRFEETMSLIAKIDAAFQNHTVKEQDIMAFYNLKFSEEEGLKPALREEMKSLIREVLAYILETPEINADAANQIRKIILDKEFERARKAFQARLSDKQKLVNGRLTYEGLFYRLICPLKDYPMMPKQESVESQETPKRAQTLQENLEKAAPSANKPEEENRKTKSAPRWKAHQRHLNFKSAFDYSMNQQVSALESGTTAPPRTKPFISSLGS